jgi:hypothetical protein
MKKRASVIALALLVVVHAGAQSVSGLTTFNSGDAISAGAMNGNFTAIANAVNIQAATDTSQTASIAALQDAAACDIVDHDM